MRNQYAVVGVGESVRSKASTASTLDMAVSASRNALADAGMDPAEIDAVMSYQALDSCDSHSVATSLGIEPTYCKDILGGGGSTEVLIADAMGLIETGICKSALIYRSLRGRSGKRMGMGAGSHWDEQAVMRQIVPNGSFYLPYGIATPGEMYGLIATRHMYLSGLTSEDLGRVCVAHYEHASRNPTALLRHVRLDIETYLDSPYICYPFRIHDYCVETDEASALIVTRADRARDLSSHPLRILGVVARSGNRNVDQFVLDDITEVASYKVGRQIYDAAEIRPEEVDIAAIYDCFSWVVLVQLEAFGLVSKPDLGGFVAEGNLGVYGALPTNTAGGMLAEGYTNGMNNIIEVVRQLRGSYRGTERQVEDCEIALCTGWDGPQSASALVLGR